MDNKKNCARCARSMAAPPPLCVHTSSMCPPFFKLWIRPCPDYL